VIAEIARGVEQTGGIGLVHGLPPEVEEQQAIVKSGETFLHRCLQGSGSRILGVFREPEVGVGAQLVAVGGNGFRLFQQVQKRLGGQVGAQTAPPTLELADPTLQIFCQPVDVMFGPLEQVGQIPSVRLHACLLALWRRCCAAIFPIRPFHGPSFQKACQGACLVSPCHLTIGCYNAGTGYGGRNR
jgi:hypothetical protein